MDTTTLPLEPGDRFLLCSDGLHGYLENGELAARMEGDRHEVAAQLDPAANHRGGRDNITVVVTDVVGD